MSSNREVMVWHRLPAVHRAVSSVHHREGVRAVPAATWASSLEAPAPHASLTSMTCGVRGNSAQAAPFEMWTSITRRYSVAAPHAKKPVVPF
jgi:hypothetical protein